MTDLLAKHGPTSAAAALRRGHRRERRRWVSRVLALALAAVIALLAVAHGSGELTTIMVAGNSMEPAMSGGDLAVARRALDYGVGDAVVVEVPEGEPGAGQIVVHRIVSENGGSIRTQGDNRDTADMWQLSEADVRGRVVTVLATAGLQRHLREPWVIGGLAALLTVAFLMPYLSPPEDDRRPRRRIRRPEEWEAWDWSSDPSPPPGDPAAPGQPGSSEVAGPPGRS